MPLSIDFTKLIHSIGQQPLRTETVQGVKDRCIDYLGATAGGVVKGSLASKLLPGAAKEGECSVIGTDRRAPCADAALLNGVTGHALELDDGHRRGYGHPAVVTFSPLFPLAEKIHSSGADFIAAATAGYEAYCRMGQAFNPGTLRRGYHTSGAVGCLSAALACASLMHLNPKQTLNALGIAGLFSSGLCITFQSGTMLKPLNTGRASFNGVTAADMAARGAEGAPDILEGKDGFIQAYSGQEVDESILLRPLGEPWGVETSYIKFYPSCRYTHAPIDCSLALRDKVQLDEIERIVITTYPTALYLAGKSDLPTDSAGSRFNIGFAAALALVKGMPSIDDFSVETAKDPRIEAVFRKIQFVEDPAYDSAVNNVRGAAMDIVTTRGTFSVRVPLPVGEPENPAPKERYAAKFHDLASGVWGEARRQEILAAIDRLEQIKDMNEFTKLLTK